MKYEWRYDELEWYNKHIYISNMGLYFDPINQY